MAPINVKNLVYNKLERQKINCFANPISILIYFYSFYGCCCYCYCCCYYCHHHHHRYLFSVIIFVCVWDVYVPILPSFFFLFPYLCLLHYLALVTYILYPHYSYKHHVLSVLHSWNPPRNFPQKG